MKKYILIFLIVSAVFAYASSFHTVKKGDTLFNISKRYGLSVDQLKRLNHLKNSNIKIGQKLRIRKSVSSSTKKKVVYHKVKKGETLWRIAYQYHLPFQKIMAWNHIRNVGDLKKGQVLTIYLDNQTANLPKPKPITYYGKLKLPVKGKAETAPLNKGINIRCRNGARVHSAGKGIVEFVGKLTGYKNVVIISHPGNMYTIYGGLGRIAVQKGQNIRSGQSIGYVSKMPHYDYPILHFEIIYHGKNVNPLKYLKKL